MTGGPPGSTSIRWAKAPRRDAYHSESFASRALHPPQSAFRAFNEIVAQLKKANTRMLLLDLDGTLVRIRKRPEDVRVSQRTKALLARLGTLPNTMVAILSGRTAQSLKSLVDVKNIRYFGLHGAEQGRRAARIRGEQRRALQTAKRSARQTLAQLPGINVEDKGFAFTVHYREAQPPAIRDAEQSLQAIMAPLRHALHVLHGKKVWEVLPLQIRGKGETMERVVADSPAAAVVYIGDDEPDEPAFAALEDHVTIRVSEDPQTRARFFLKSPGEVLRFLGMLEKELRNN